MRLLLFLLLSTPLWAQSVVPATSYTDKFHRTSGWSGADGTYSIPVGDRTLWMFSDTFIGEVEDGRRTDFVMVNNSLVMQEGEVLDFVQSPIFSPPDNRGWFWLMDGIHHQGEFEILLGQFIKQGEGPFGFAQAGNWYARFVLDCGRARVIEYQKLPHFGQRDNDQITWGSAILPGPVWTYIYGTRDIGENRHYVVARVPRGRMREVGTWRFFDGQGWGRDKWQTRSLFVGGSNESSVHFTRDGGCLYVGTSPGFFGGEVVARYAPSPAGPWGEQLSVYKAPEMKGNVYTYNTKAHPELSTDGRLLISYNVNTTDLDEVVENADIYRPRFIWWTPPQAGWVPKAKVKLE